MMFSSLLSSLKLSQISKWLIFLQCAIALLICLIYSITLGARDIPLRTILTSFTKFDHSFDHLVVQTVRLPRSLMAIAVSAALAVLGTVMQGLTRNPLTETGILGIEAGGSLVEILICFSRSYHSC